MNSNRNYTAYNANANVTLIGKELGVNSVTFNTINLNADSTLTANDGEKIYNILKGSFFVDPGYNDNGPPFGFASTDYLFQFPIIAEGSSNTTQTQGACLLLKLVISDFSGNNLQTNSEITKSQLYNITAISPYDTTTPPEYQFEIDTTTTDTNDQYNTTSPIDAPFLNMENILEWDNINKRFLFKLSFNENITKHLIRGIYTII